MKIVVIVVCVMAASAMGYGIFNILSDSDDEKKGDVNTTGNRIAVIETSYGTIRVELYEDKAPQTTGNFIKLANQGFYDGLCFHRVIDDFMIQGGGFTHQGQQFNSDQIPFPSPIKAC